MYSQNNVQSSVPETVTYTWQSTRRLSNRNETNSQHATLESNKKKDKRKKLNYSIFNTQAFEI
jgi:hypothetical protein